MGVETQVRRAETIPIFSEAATTTTTTTTTAAQPAWDTCFLNCIHQCWLTFTYSDSMDSWRRLKVSSSAFRRVPQPQQRCVVERNPRFGHQRLVGAALAKENKRFAPKRVVSSALHSDEWAKVTLKLNCWKFWQGLVLEHLNQIQSILCVMRKKHVAGRGCDLNLLHGFGVARAYLKCKYTRSPLE